MSASFFEDPPHVIRLRGPWHYEVIDGDTDSDLSRIGRIQMPSDWAATLGPNFQGTVRYTRNFNCPTGLNDLVRVLLVVVNAQTSATMTLNRQPLGSSRFDDGPWAADVTELLTQRNTLCVEVTHSDRLDDEAPASDSARCGGLTGDVRLEIGQTPLLASQ